MIQDRAHTHVHNAKHMQGLVLVAAASGFQMRYVLKVQKCARECLEREFQASLYLTISAHNFAFNS